MVAAQEHTGLAYAMGEQMVRHDAVNGDNEPPHSHNQQRPPNGGTPEKIEEPREPRGIAVGPGRGFRDQLVSLTTGARSGVEPEGRVRAALQGRNE